MPAFPPMPTSAPKPLSQALSPTIAATAASPGTAKSGTDVDFKGVLTRFYQENSPGKVAEVDSTLQKYKVSKVT